MLSQLRGLEDMTDSYAGTEDLKHMINELLPHGLPAYREAG